MPYSRNISTPVHFCFITVSNMCCLSRSASLWDHYSGSTRTNCLLQMSASPSRRQCHSVNVRPIFSQRRQQLFFSRRLIAADFQWCWPEYVHIQCFSPPSPRFPRCSLAGKRKWRTRDSPTKMQFSKRNGFGSSIMHEAGFSFLSELWHYFPVEFLSPPWPLPSSGHSRADSVRRVE